MFNSFIHVEKWSKKLLKLKKVWLFFNVVLERVNGKVTGSAG